MKDVKSSVALYSVSSHVDGARIAQGMGMRSSRAITEMLTTAREPLIKDPELVASILQGAMTGVTRRLLECGAPKDKAESVRQELILLVNGYLAACSAPAGAAATLVL
jgi:hypothetical protein